MRETATCPCGGTLQFFTDWIGRLQECCPDCDRRAAIEQRARRAPVVTEAPRVRREDQPDRLKRQKQIGRLIRERRKALGITPKQLCAAIGGYSVTTLVVWECGRGSPGVNVRPALARELGLEPEQLENEFVGPSNPSVSRPGFGAFPRRSRKKQPSQDQEHTA